MEKLKLSRTLLEKALKTLADSFVAIEESEKSKNYTFILAAKDSNIQRFEYCFDSFWKFLKHYLAIKYDIQDANSPKSVFRSAFEQGVCKEDEADLLVKMVGDRNVTSHNYDIEQVREIIPNISVYYRVMNEVLNRIE